MYLTELRNRIHIPLSKIVLLTVCLFARFVSFAQEERMYNAEHDEKPYYFGITLGFNSSQYKISQSDYFITYDTIKNITPLWRPGFQLGIMGNARLSSFVDIRAIPTFMLREQALRFTDNRDTVMTTSFESILFTLPIEFKFKSDRQQNFRFFVCGGGKIDFDFNANARSKRANEVIRIKPFDYGYNIGLGFEFYYPNFIFAPEIKISNGLGNSLLRNVGEPTNKAIDKITTRQIIISFHIEG